VRVREVADLLVSHGISAVPVVDGGWSASCPRRTWFPSSWPLTLALTWPQCPTHPLASPAWPPR
jgi:hypothetical protein